MIQLDGLSKTPELRFWDCFPDERQGISAGWGDQYHHATEGQELEITGAPPGVYYLVSTSNPDKAFLETDYGNNASSLLFRLRWRAGMPSVRVLRGCPDSERCDQR